MPAAELAADVIYQIGALDGLARVAGSRVAYVKPHGALYHSVIDDAVQARAVVDAVGRVEARIPLGVQGAIDVGLPKALEATVYARWGDKIILILLMICVSVDICFIKINKYARK